MKMATMRRGVIGLAIVAAALAGIGIGAVGVVVAPPRHIFVNRATLQVSPALRALRFAADRAAASSALQIQRAAEARPDRRHPRFVVM